MKRFLMCALMFVAIFAVCITLQPTEAQAASTSDLTFTLNDDGNSYSVTACDSTASGSLTIPSTYNGKPVTTIGEWAFYMCDELTSVTIPDSVTTIGSYAFRDCTGLTSVTIPDSVTTIGGYAFRDCTGLTSVTIPDSITTIGDLVFYNCVSLTGIWVSEDNPNYSSDSYGVLFNKDKTKLIEAPGAISGDYNIPDSVTTIGYCAFSNRDSLTYVTIPDSVTRIGFEAFRDCTSLTSVTIGNGVTTIGNYAFYGCTSLTSVTIPNSVTTIGPYAFYKCTSLAYNVYDNAKYLGNADNPYLVLNEVSSTTISSCEIHPDTKFVVNRAFYRCTNLTSVTIGNSVTSIGDDAFSSCTSLTSVTIGNSVTGIGDGAFSSCTSLISVAIPDSVTTIGSRAFQGSTSLTNVTIPDSVTTVGYNSFTNCTNLTYNVYDNANYLGNTSNPYVALIKASSTTISSCEIHLNTRIIANEAFSNCSSLTGVTIPDSVTTIGDYAFYYCSSLTSLTIGNSVTTVGYNAFANCTSLTSLTIGNSVTSIGDGAFQNCTSLTSLTIPDSVTTIGNYAFQSCTSLTSVTIPDSVTTIGRSAFCYCSSLSDVYYTGTQEQWDAISVGGSNDYLLSATLHLVNHCTAYGHTVVTIPGRPATCMREGLTDGKACSRCGEILLAQAAISKGEHSEVLIPGAPATCSKPGISDGVACGECGEILVAQTEIPVTEHTYDHDFDLDCNICDAVRKISGTYEFVNYRVVFDDEDISHLNHRVIIYKLGDKTVTDPTDETALKKIDSKPVTKWGARNINRILLTDAGNYVLLLKYNVGTGAATVVPMQISVSADPKLIIDENNKITVIDNDEQNTNHRAVVYYLGENTVEDIYDTEALKAIDPEAKTHWQKTRINRLALTKGGNYVLHLEYNVGSEKRTVAQQFAVFSIPNLKVDQNNMLVATEENPENKNHRVTVFYLGDATVEDPFDETAVKNAAISSKTYWGLSSINKVEITEGGNYVIHLYYNVGTSAKRTLALDVTLNDRPELSVDESGKIIVECDDPAISNYRAFIYNVGDKEVEDIYDEAALEAIATPSKSWGLSAIAKKTLTPGTYVIHLHYNVNGGAKSTIAIRVTI